jgi:hypothetical protein
MDSMTNGLNESVDQECVSLILQAKKQGIEIDEIRVFLGTSLKEGV